MSGDLTGTRGARFLFVAACFVIVVGGLKIGAPILLPFTLAFFLAILSLPLLAWMRARRFPSWLAITLTMVANIALVGLLVLIVSQSLAELRASLPEYVDRFQRMTTSTIHWLQVRRVPVSDSVATELFDPAAVLDLAGRALRGAASLVSKAFLVLLIMIFILAEATVFPAKFRRAFGNPGADLSRFLRITYEVQQYLGIKSVVSLATGVLVGIWVWVLGVDFPLLWGMVAFLFNYIPSIGSILASGPPILLSLLQFGPGKALLVGAGYLVVNTILGNIIEPNLQGRRLGLSTLVVILSLVFWGWVWGPVGMLLSLPLTMIVKIMLEHTDDLRWAAVLLGGPPPPEEGLEGADQPPTRSTSTALS